MNNSYPPHHQPIPGRSRIAMEYLGMLVFFGGIIAFYITPAPGARAFIGILFLTMLWCVVKLAQEDDSR